MEVGVPFPCGNSSSSAGALWRLLLPPRGSLGICLEREEANAVTLCARSRWVVHLSAASRAGPGASCPQPAPCPAPPPPLSFVCWISPHQGDSGCTSGVPQPLGPILPNGTEALVPPSGGSPAVPQALGLGVGMFVHLLGWAGKTTVLESGNFVSKFLKC